MTIFVFECHITGCFKDMSHCDVWQSINKSYALKPRYFLLPILFPAGHEWVTAIYHNRDKTKGMALSGSPPSEILMGIVSSKQAASKPASSRFKILKRFKACGGSAHVWRGPLMQPEATAVPGQGISWLNHGDSSPVLCEKARIPGF